MLEDISPGDSSSRSRSSILSFFPKGKVPRDNQIAILEQIERNWEDHDVFVVDAPVGSGKSLVATTVASWAYSKKIKSAILAPNNILVRQYQQDFPWIPALKKQTSYQCKKYSGQTQQLNCKQSKAIQGHFCQGRGGLCSYLQDVRKVQSYPLSITNYHSFLAYKSYRPLVIYDEAHHLLNIIGEGAAKKFWQHTWNFPSYVQDYRTLHTWVVAEIKKLSERGLLFEPLLLLQTELESSKLRYIFSRGEALYRGQVAECILASPVDISEEKPLFWPKKVKKLLMLSATFNSRDIKELGLSKRRVLYVKSESPIPKDRRPWYFLPVANMSYASQDRDLPKLKAWLETFLLSKKEKGIIHAPYPLAKKLRGLLSNDRLLFHDTFDKIEVFKEFQKSTDKVMVASGLYEGVSLDEDLARWQVICKIPWPSLAEPAMEYMCKEDPEFYANKTIKDIVQTYGRVCRGPTDYGETYIIDVSFKRLLERWSNLFPVWFLEGKDEKR
jgi:Rad3-related DNA helicase